MGQECGIETAPGTHEFRHQRRARRSGSAVRCVGRDGAGNLIIPVGGKDHHIPRRYGLNREAAYVDKAACREAGEHIAPGGGPRNGGEIAHGGREDGRRACRGRHRRRPRSRRYEVARSAHYADLVPWYEVDVAFGRPVIGVVAWGAATAATATSTEGNGHLAGPYDLDVAMGEAVSPDEVHPHLEGGIIRQAKAVRGCAPE